MNKSFVQRKRSSKRPYSTPANAKPGSGDSKSLPGQSGKVQDWLNEKAVKGLQVLTFMSLYYRIVSCLTFFLTNIG